MVTGKSFTDRLLTALIIAVLTSTFIAKLWLGGIPFGGWGDYNEVSFAGAARNLMEGRGPFIAPVNVHGNAILKVTPIFIYLLTFSFSLFGVNEFAARVVTLIFSTGSLFALFLLGRLLFNSRVGLLAAALTTANGIFTIFGFNVQSDIMFVFFMLYGLYWYLRSVKENNQRHLIIAGLCSGLAFAAKYTAGILWLIVVLCELGRIFIENGVWKTALKRVLIFGVLTVSISLPFMIYNLIDIGLPYLAYIMGSAITLGESTVGRVIYFIWKTFNPLEYPFILAGFVMQLRQVRKSISAISLISWIAFFLIFIYYKNPHEYYTLPLVPIASLFAAVSISALYDAAHNNLRRMLAALLAAALILSSLGITYVRFIHRKIGYSEYKELGAYCNVSRQHTVFTFREPSFIAADYYVRSPIRLIHDLSIIETERKKNTVFVYGQEQWPENEALSRAATETRIICRTVYDPFSLRKGNKPILKVHRFEKK